MAINIQNRLSSLTQPAESLGQQGLIGRAIDTRRQNKFNTMLMEGSQPGMAPRPEATEQARKFAIQNRMWDKVEQLDEKTRKQMAESSLGIAKIAHALHGSDLDENQRKAKAAELAQQAGINPQAVDLLNDWSDPSLEMTARMSMDMAGKFAGGKKVHGQQITPDNKLALVYSDGTVEKTDIDVREPARIVRGPDGTLRIGSGIGGNAETIIDPDTTRENAAQLAGAESEAKRRGAMSAEQQTELRRNTTKMEALESKAGRQIDQIDRALEKAGRFSTGIFGGLNWTDNQRDLEALITNIKAFSGFEELNEMRANNKLGAGLGNVTEQEIKFLQNVEAALLRSQSLEQFREQLNLLKEHVAGRAERMRRAHEQDIASGYYESLFLGDGQPQTQQPAQQSQPVDYKAKYGLE